MADGYDSLPEGFALDGPAAAPAPVVGYDTLPAGFAMDHATDQMTGIMRKPAIFGSGVAKGLTDLAATLGGGAAASGAAEGGLSDPMQYLPATAGAITDAARSTGAIDRPNLVPQNPAEKIVASAGEGVGGALPFAAVGGLPGLAWGVGTGATGGAAGEVAAEAAPDHPLIARAVGNLAGGFGLFGALKSLGYISRPAIEAIERSVMPGAVDRQAADLATKAVMSDMKSGGPGPDAISDALASANGKPLTVADVAGENTQALLGKAYRTPGPQRQLIKSTLEGRDAGAGERITGDVDSALTGGAWTNPADIMAARQAAAKPAYDAFETAPALNPDTVAAGGELDKMMSRPSMNKAALNALNLAKEEGRDPASLGLTFNEAGDPKFEKVPSWQTLDYLKRGLDDVVEKYRDPVTKTLNLDTAGRATNSTRAAFLNFVDRENPAYAEARAAWGGPTQSLAAMKDGAASLNLSPTDAYAQLSRLSPGDQTLFRQGAMDAYARQIGNTSLGGNEALSVMGNATKQQRLLALAKDNDSYMSAMKALAAEKKMFDLKTSTLGGSQTAARLAEDGAGGGAHGGTPLALAASELFSGKPLPAAAILGSRYLSQVFGKTASMSPEVNASVARILLSRDPNSVGLLQRIAPTGKLQPSATVPLGLIGSLGGQTQ